MGRSNAPTPVFVETNLGTRLAVPVSPIITTKDFKRELEWMHLNCFPELGRIKVNALMVKQKSRFYHLSESLPLKYAFPGSNAGWFLHVETLKCNNGEVQNIDSVNDVVTHLENRRKCKRKMVKICGSQKFSTVVCFLKRKRKWKNVKEKRRTLCSEQGHIMHDTVEVNSSKDGDKNAVAAAPSDTFSEPASVAGIIKKYFSDYDEVASSHTVRTTHREWLKSSNECKYLYLNVHSPLASQHADSEKKPNSEAPNKDHTKPEVGKRLLLASQSLGLSPNNQSVLSLCRVNDGKSPSSLVRNLVFEMAEESD